MKKSFEVIAHISLLAAVLTGIIAFVIIASDAKRVVYADMEMYRKGVNCPVGKDGNRQVTVTINKDGTTNYRC